MTTPFRIYSKFVSSMGAQDEIDKIILRELKIG